jgi:hypothetical protein
MRIAREDIFGPIISAISFDDVDDPALQRNCLRPRCRRLVEGRLDLYRVAYGLPTGIVWAHSYQLMDPAIPFDGRGVGPARWGACDVGGFLKRRPSPTSLSRSCASSASCTGSHAR